MFGTRTTAAVRASLAHIDTNLDAVSDDLATLYGDTRECLAEVKTAAQTGSLAFIAVTIVAVIGLLIASAALVQSSTKG